MTSLRALPKSRTPRTRRQRSEALELFLRGARDLGVREAWLIGSMATGRDNPYSDVDLCVRGPFRLIDLYNLRDRIYTRTGVIIQISLEAPRNPKVRLI